MADDQITRPTPDDRSSSGAPSSLNGLTMALGIEPSDPPVDPLLGRNLGGVTIVRPIAEGGMGRVYEGLQETPKRKVAVKVMRPGFVSRQAIKRFGMELEILGRLRHPYIAPIFSAGTCDVAGCSVPFFVMEYIPDALPITRFAEEKILGVDARLKLFRKVCEAIAHGHEQGIVHRDLKPSNILVEPSGIPKVIDFGIARTVGNATETMTALTELGQLIGTLQYMSPEQIEADPTAVDQRTDVYALGVILYELLTGARPYELARRQVLEAAQIILNQKPISPLKLNSKLSPGIVKVTGVCLQKDRQRRYADAAELASAVGSCITNTSITSCGEGPDPKTWRSGLPQAHPVHALAFIILTAIAVAAAVYGLTYLRFPVTELLPNQPAQAVAPFDAFQARMHQQAWARQLGVEVATTNSVGATLIIIPAGRFMMGKDTNTHEVTIFEPFFFGETPVTQKQWREVMGTAPWQGQEHAIEGDDVAATFISWEDANLFCEKLTNQERGSGGITFDQQYRLPTEAEWEFACRAGTVTRYSFGDDEAVLGDYAWFGGGSPKNPVSAGNTGSCRHAQTVRLKFPNAFGLYDMHGNVSCWCAGRRDDNHHAVATDTQGPDDEPNEILRGGSWYDLPAKCQSSSRHSGSARERSSRAGFRLLLTTPPADHQISPESKWRVLFRSDDPSMWNTDTKLTDEIFAMRLALGWVRYLRLRRTDSNEYVVIPLDVDERDLGKQVVKGRYVWNGQARVVGAPPGRTSRLLGIADTKAPTRYKSLGIQVVQGEGRGVGLEGWGFGRQALVFSEQFYAWGGDAIEKVIFEIAVTADDLSEEDRPYLLPE
jgi:formylglycine-generating enzyme required for sulfatase activity